MNNEISNEVKYGLKRVIFIESARFRYVDLDIDMNTLLVGDSGVGKTSIMRAILFFYTMSANKEILGLSDGEAKKSFNDWYFDVDGASHIAYEYTTENGNFLFVVSRISKLHYTFIDLEKFDSSNLETLFLDDSNVPMPQDKVATRLASLGLEYYSTQKREEYRNIFCLDEYKKLSPDFKRKNLSNIKFYLFSRKKDIEVYGKYLTKIFLNNKVSETSIKDMLTSLLDVSEDKEASSVGIIDLDDIQSRLERIERKESDNNRFISRLATISEAELDIEEYSKSKIEIRNIKNELLQVLENHNQIMNILHEEKVASEYQFKEMEKLSETEKKKMKSEIREIENSILLLENKIADTEEKEDKYEKLNIKKLIRRSDKESYFVKKQESIVKRLNLLSTSVQNLKVNMQQQKVDSDIEINKKYEERKSILTDKSKSFPKQYSDASDYQKKRNEEELSPIETELSDLDKKIQNCENDNRVYESEVKGLRGKNRENEIIKDVKDEIKKVSAKLRESSTLFKDVQNQIQTQEDKQNSNSINYTTQKEKIEKENDTEILLIKENIETLENQKNQLLCIDKDSLFGNINRDNSSFKEHISFIVKDEILHDETLEITKVDEGVSLYGYNLDISSQSIENKINDIKYKISQYKKDISASSEKRKKEIKELDSKTKMNNKKIAIILKNLNSQRIKYEREIGLLEIKIDGHNKLLQIEVKKEDEKIKNEITRMEEIILENIKKNDVSKDKSSMLKKECSDKYSDILEEYNNRITSLNNQSDLINKELDDVTKVTASEKEKAFQEIETSYKIALNKENLNPNYLSYLNNRNMNLKKLLAMIRKHSTDVGNYQIKDEIEISLLASKKESLLTFITKKKTLESFYVKKNKELNEDKEKAKKQMDAYQSSHKVMKQFFDNKEDYIESYELANIDILQEDTLDDLINSIKTNIEDTTTIPKTIDTKNEHLKIIVLQLEKKITKITDGFTKDNTLGLPIVDGEVNTIFEYRIVAKSYIDFKNNELYKQNKDLAIDSISDTIKLIESNVSNIRIKLEEMESLLDDVNSSVEKSIKSIKVLDVLKVNYSEDNHNIILNEFDKLIEYSDKHSYVYLGSLIKEEDKIIFENILDRIKVIIKQLEGNRKRQITLSDLISINFKITENGQDLGTLTSLNDVGSNGTGIMAKAIIYIALLYKNSLKCRLHKNQYFHCIIDEIGQMSEDYFKQLMDTSEKQGFLFLNGIPVKSEEMIHLYPNVYTGFSVDNVSDFVNTTKKVISFE